MKKKLPDLAKYLISCVVLAVSILSLSAQEVKVINALSAVPDKGLYTPNRTPLIGIPFMKLPPGAIIPKGWLRHQLELDASGIPGQLDEISRFLKFDETNGWKNPNSWAWEELPYWLRGYCNLGYVLKDEKIIAKSKLWLDAIIATAQPDGYFGPISQRPGLKDGIYDAKDSWAHMLAITCLRSFYEYSGDERTLKVISNFFHWVNEQPTKYFTSGWGALRWADQLANIYWLYNITGDPFLLDLAKQIHEKTANYTTALGNGHNVNWSQGFREPAEYFQQSKEVRFRDANVNNYNKVMGIYGQFSGGGLCGDEGWRPGYRDPRQGFETCGFVEYMLSFEILQRITGDGQWADRCENIAFNSLPATMEPDHRALHYITCANSINLNNEHKQLGQFGNGPFPMLAYEPSPHNYRCCTHNYGMGWPFFTETLWLATYDNGLCASMYTASEVTAKVADGTAVTISETTDYPFKDVLNFKVSTPKEMVFPIYFRVPGWCTAAELSINGKKTEIKATPLSYIRVERSWKTGDLIKLVLPMAPKIHTWTANSDAVSVNYGPLNFSLDIGEKWTTYVPEKYDKPNWGGFEVAATTPWNYGLIIDNQNPIANIKVIQKPGPLADNPFTHEGAPLMLTAKARKIPDWRADNDLVVGPLQQSPALTKQPIENVNLIPAGAARLRITSFPTVSTDSKANEWIPSPANLTNITSSYIEWPYATGAVIYGVEPKSSHDFTIPRFTWWNHRGTKEWLQFRFHGTTQISAVAVYWFEDKDQKWDIDYQGCGNYKAPASWTLEYHDGKSWKPLKGAVPVGGTLLNQYNQISFPSIKAYSIRIVAQLDKGACAGIYAVKVFDGKTQIIPTNTPKAEKLLMAGSKNNAEVPNSWYSSENIKLEDGSGIKVWTDASANGIDASQGREKVNPPTLVSKAINGMPAVHFDGAKRQVLSFPRQVSDDFTIALVYQSSVGLGNATDYNQGSLLLGGNTRNNSNDYGISLNAKGQILAGTSNPLTTIISPSGFNDGKPHLIVFTRIKANGGLTLSIDGKKVGDANSSNFTSLTSSDLLGIGATPKGESSFTGDIGEILIYPAILNQTHLKEMETGLMKKWGVK